MASTPSNNPNVSRAGGWLARLKGLVQTMKPESDTPDSEEVPPTWDVTPPPAMPVGEAVPAAERISTEEGNSVAPLAEALPSAPPPQAVEPESSEPTSPSEESVAAAVEVPETPAEMQEPLEESPSPAPVLCPICGAARRGEEPSCGDCGYYFSPTDLESRHATPSRSGNSSATNADLPMFRLKDRFEAREKISERCGVTRYRGLDHGDGSGAPVPVIIARQAVIRPAEPLSGTGASPGAEEPPAAEPVAASEDDAEFLPTFDEPASPEPHLTDTDVLPAMPVWPSLDWEQTLLVTLKHPGLPAVLDRFTEGDFDYLVEEIPAGRSLWDAWDDPEADSGQRFGHLAEIAAMLHQLHTNFVFLESLRPEIIVITSDGRVRLTDLSELLPFPLPADVPLRRSLYTAPEVLAGKADARADLYSFGAMLYALHVGRDLNEIDFDRSGTPKPFIPRFPDIHPALGRLMTKTFRTTVEGRFPSDEAGREDATGFMELIRTLRTLGRTVDNVRLEIASWTTTGMVRTGNEDAFALLHACESRQDDLSEMALVMLCDGMGGYEAGEIAAAMAIQIMRENLVKQKTFAPLSGESSFPEDANEIGAPQARNTTAGHAAPPINVEAVKQLLRAALKQANKQIYIVSRLPGAKRRGMGCTAEAVFVDGRNVVVGHVGDSRTYHLHEGRLIQMTRDQTLVNRLVELGTLTPEEAETHPRRNELQQALGGQPDVEPGLYHGALKAGDWVVVCSDGLSNHVSNADLVQMLSGEGYSAETVARRLVNLANLQGATDNATVVVIRAT